jgi:hypothetical protein
MNDVVITGIVFFSLYQTIKLLSEHFLKKRLIITGHVEQASILSTPVHQSEEVNRYPSLKWGLVAFMAGLGLIIVEVIRSYNPDGVNWNRDVLPYGIELVFISLGFLIYFFIMNSKKK